MSTVPVQYLKQHLAEILEQVLRGDSVLITRRNRPIAEIHPVASRSGRRRGSQFGQGELGPLPFSVDAAVLRKVIDEDRSDER